MKFIENPKKQFLFFILLFCLLNFIQSHFTGLLDDESYYWVWSKQLAFGYFDHPPLVALWIKISSFFFSGHLGVRFFSIISFSISLYFCWKCIDHAKKWDYVWLYFLLILSVALLNVYGFITVPDTPLVLFTALFLFAYKRFLETNSTKFALLLGAAMAGMLYSKYHGILIILLVLASHLELLKNKKFWLASIFGAFLFMPHILWQFNQEFPSIRYHLFERGKKPYKFEYTLMHLVNLIAIVGLTFPVIYYAFFKQKIESVFQKSLKFIVVGFMVFFFFASFKTSTQAQWNGTILIPIVILTFGYFVDHKNSRKWLIYLGLGNLIVMLIARVVLASPSLSPIVLETHNGKEWAETIRKKTGQRPIVFKSSYKRASKYRFYTGIKTHSQSTLKTRKSQYDLSDFEKQMQNENITIVGDSITGDTLYKTRTHLFFADKIDNYLSFNNIECFIPYEQVSLKLNQENKLNFEVFNPYEENIEFKNMKFVVVFQGKKNKVIKELPMHFDEKTHVATNEKKHVQGIFKLPEKMSPNILTLRVAVRFYQLPSGYQGNKVNVSFTND